MSVALSVDYARVLIGARPELREGSLTRAIFAQDVEPLQEPCFTDSSFATPTLARGRLLFLML